MIINKKTNLYFVFEKLIALESDAYVDEGIPNKTCGKSE